MGREILMTFIHSSSSSSSSLFFFLFSPQSRLTTFLPFNSSIKWLKHNLILNWKFYIMIMGGVWFSYLCLLFSYPWCYHHTTCPRTSEQNGIAEPKNRHLLEVTCALLFQMKVPKVFWANALLTAAYLINRLPTIVLDFQWPIKRFLQSAHFSFSFGRLEVRR